MTIGYEWTKWNHNWNAAELLPPQTSFLKGMKSNVRSVQPMKAMAPSPSLPRLIVNSPPVIGSILLTPSTPTSQDDITCQAVDVTDADGEEVSLTYFDIDGAPVTEDGTVLSASFSVDATFA